MAGVGRQVEQQRSRGKARPPPSLTTATEGCWPEQGRGSAGRKSPCFGECTGAKAGGGQSVHRGQSVSQQAGWEPQASTMGLIRTALSFILERGGGASHTGEKA